MYDQGLTVFGSFRDGFIKGVKSRFEEHSIGIVGLCNYMTSRQKDCQAKENDHQNGEANRTYVWAVKTILKV